MTARWIIELFQPEDSSQGMAAGRSDYPVPITVGKGEGVSMKALFWILISILTGLAIGQLC